MSGKNSASGWRWTDSASKCPKAKFCLLGHNGAGKSTAIGMMLGQVWPTQGEVLICGHDVTRRRQLALQRVGAIFETPVFYDYLSGWRNLGDPEPLHGANVAGTNSRSD